MAVFTIRKATMVMLMIPVALLFQMKQLKKVNKFTSNTSTLSDSATASTLLLPSSSKNSNKAKTGDDTNLSGSASDGNKQADTKYPDCPFRHSSLVESIYIYPSPGTPEFTGNILSEYARSRNNNFPEYPWVAIDADVKRLGVGPYKPNSQMSQYSTEILVRDILTHPKSACLRTNDPEKAKLFYVPYLPAVEFHNGTKLMGDMATSPYGQALADVIVEGKYENWETRFGLTSKYWKRRNGSDHILVYSEPMHGLWHPSNKRGNFHFIKSQYQLRPPIAVSVELSTTFVDMYPSCAKKNILMPYPNTDGRWFNGAMDQEAISSVNEMGMYKASDSSAALLNEIQLEERQHLSAAAIAAASSPGSKNVDGKSTALPRILAQFYKAGHHGSCKGLRISMSSDYKCTPSGKFASDTKMKWNYAHGYRQATFCPCPGGDSPSAKRMFDALFSGCIPVILSHDYVWPFTKEFDRFAGNTSMASSTATSSRNLIFDRSKSGSNNIAVLNPEEYSIRLPAEDHQNPKFGESCQRITTGADLQSLLEAVSVEELVRLKQGVEHAAYAYSYYSKRRDLPDNPLQESVLPDGGAAQVFIRALEERAEGKLWPDCERELKGIDPSNDRVKSFTC